MYFKDAILSGDFNRARELSSNMDGESLLEALFLIAYEEESIAPYGFANFQLLEEETSENHYVISFILSMALNYLGGAYQISFHHAKKAIELSPYDISYKEYLLYFNALPEKLLKNEEAIEVANLILVKDPTNTTALKVINELKN
ncbi:hypothetical protein AN960_03695 [Bacillus sp. FJAT-25509]|uniref:hypothetical protein n=1 Tax=Bacillus sp. FJAT-25509 TaxID=1712029 RepID=UPI0006FDD4C2|nr:hypothetical protein [Bacillus sp. FJAT-25509]KQL42351.1 hypothetical protein AN960_03695 [Bacillus sp. FJAT-25509]